MVWRPTDPQGNEAAKIRFEVLPYCKGGFDFGCGATKVWPHMIGVDNRADERIFGIQTNPNLVVETCERMPVFASETAETIFSSHLLEHIVDWRGALAEWWRLVKPGGFLVLYLPHRHFYPNRGQPGANPDHKHDFIPEDIVGAMREIAPDWSLMERQDRNGGLEYSFLLVFRKDAPGSGHAYPCDAPRPPKKAGVVRFGGHGDAVWSSSPIALLKEEGFHVTVYATAGGADVLRHDPHIDKLITIPEGALSNDELIAWYAHEGVKFDRWVNLIGSVEGRLLAHVNELPFWWPHDVRQELMGANYLEEIHRFARVPHDFRQRFYPTADEVAWRDKMRALLPGPLVVIAPSGSSPAKYWPHSQRLMELLAERGVYSTVLGARLPDDVVGLEPFGSVVGMEWPLRNALTWACGADAVVATESVVANAVALEEMLKVVTLSHSSAENLTKHWRNTVGLEPRNVSCHPCHRILSTLDFCPKAPGPRPNAALCQHVIEPEIVAGLVFQFLERTGKLPAKAA